MNEFMVKMGFVAYGVLSLSELVIYDEIPNDSYISLPKQMIEIVVNKMNHLWEAPQSTLGDLPKDFRLNMKRRPPIILGAL